MSGQGYIYIPNWDGPHGFQHYGKRRPSWIKNYLDLLDNDAYLDLSLADRGVLHAIWMLVARVGQGRCIYSASYLQKQCNAPAGHMRLSLERLNHAGFIEVRASRALAPVYQTASPEVEGSNEPKDKTEDARAIGAAMNGAVTLDAKEELKRALAVCRSVTDGDTPAHTEHTIRDLYPELADNLIATISKERTT